MNDWMRRHLEKKINVLIMKTYLTINILKSKWEWKSLTKKELICSFAR